MTHIFLLIYSGTWPSYLTVFLSPKLVGVGVAENYPRSSFLFELIVLFYMDSLNKTRSILYTKVHEVKKALNKKTLVR